MSTAVEMLHFIDREFKQGQEIKKLECMLALTRGYLMGFAARMSSKIPEDDLKMLGLLNVTIGPMETEVLRDEKHKREMPKGFSDD